jgi:hypothetical protein
MDRLYSVVALGQSRALQYYRERIRTETVKEGHPHRIE